MSEAPYFFATPRRCCGHGVYVRILKVGWLGALEVDGDGEGVQWEEVDGIRFGGCEGQRLLEMLLVLWKEIKISQGALEVVNSAR